MLRDKKRKEVSLDTETIELLQIQAEKEGRKLKNYMELILREKANSFELSDNYKLMMDVALEKHKKGKTTYTSWDEIKKNL